MKYVWYLIFYKWKLKISWVGTERKSDFLGIKKSFFSKVIYFKYTYIKTSEVNGEYKNTKDI